MNATLVRIAREQGMVAAMRAYDAGLTTPVLTGAK